MHATIIHMIIVLLSNKHDLRLSVHCVPLRRGVQAQRANGRRTQHPNVILSGRRDFGGSIHVAAPQGKVALQTREAVL